MLKKTLLFNAWKKEDNDHQLIQTQKRFIYLIAGICLLLGIGWMTSPSRLTVYIPPDINNGATLKVGTIPNPLIYSFAYQIWQETNYWPADGSIDYPHNIHAYWSYITPQFRAELLQEADDLKASGQAQRQRFVQGLMGAAYNSASVKKLSDSTWEVDLSMRLTEMKNNQTVKDVEILYPLKVVRMDISQRDNPYQLAIAGFVSEPVRLKTYV